jgi:uncharacterized protein (DUF305 family)
LPAWGWLAIDMIPHHAGAILDVSDPRYNPDIKRLCSTIVSGRLEEIDDMKAKLRQLEESSR